MDPATARAIAELGRAAARQAGIPDDVVITMTIIPDREDQIKTQKDNVSEQSISE